MKLFRAEFHIHTVLSPCGDIEMIPPLIAQEAVNKNIDIIAITDHNHTGNIKAVQEAAEGLPLAVIPGMELQTREDIHVICLFETLEQAEKLQTIVDKNLPKIKNNPEYFGEQFVVDKTGDFVRREERLLINSTSLSLNKACQIVHDLGGLFIPAHVTRQMFGLLPTLGFIPPDIPFDALELNLQASPEKAKKNYPGLNKFPIIQSGDSHYLADIFGKNLFSMKNPSIIEIQQTLKGINGREMLTNDNNPQR